MMPSFDECFQDLLATGDPAADEIRRSFGRWVAAVSVIVYDHATEPGAAERTARFEQFREWCEQRMLLRVNTRPTPIVDTTPEPRQAVAAQPVRRPRPEQPWESMSHRGSGRMVPTGQVSLNRSRNLPPPPAVAQTSVHHGRPGAPTTDERPPHAVVEDLLARFAAAQARAGGMLGGPDPALDGQSVAERLQSLYLALLRVDDGTMHQWRAEAARVYTDHRPSAGLTLPPLPGPVDTAGLLLPAGDGCPAMYTNADGLMLTEVATALGAELADTGAHFGIGVPVSLALAVAPRDLRLRYASEGAALMEPATDEGHRFVSSELLFKLEMLRANENDPVEYLRAMIDVDAALRSFVHFPLVARESWWGRLVAASYRSVVATSDRLAQTGVRPRIEELTGSYGSLLDRGVVKGGEWDLRYPVPSMDAGQVLVCLRLYSEVDGVRQHGRVMCGARS